MISYGEIQKQNDPFGDKIFLVANTHVISLEGIRLYDDIGLLFSKKEKIQSRAKLNKAQKNVESGSCSGFT